MPEIDQKFEAYEKSINPQERERLLSEIQTYILDNHIFVPVYRLVFFEVVGPRLANKWDEVIAAIPQYIYVGPYEDIRIKE